MVLQIKEVQTSTIPINQYSTVLVALLNTVPTIFLIKFLFNLFNSFVYIIYTASHLTILFKTKRPIDFNRDHFLPLKHNQLEGLE